jgi:hypothetical protein
LPISWNVTNLVRKNTNCYNKNNIETATNNNNTCCCGWEKCANWLHMGHGSFLLLFLFYFTIIICLLLGFFWFFLLVLGPWTWSSSRCVDPLDT